MSELGQNTATQGGSDLVGKFNQAFKRGDIAFALGLVCILVMLILPVPSWLLDFTLALSFAFAVMILMTVVFIQKPLEFSSFPTVLLIATMLRLALNLASTRLILSDGHTGTDAAGKVIEAFGNFVMGGNFVIGMIVFGILVIVNFVVITKGSGRIAEVSARFSLDAMPGKQMAIDADLSAGLIDEETAKTRRKELEDESNFFGAMDGAAKFVRGDAIAGILITFINILGGIIIGVAQHDLTFSDATGSYTLLTVGDGLVSQIPALVVSTAAGMLVSKAGVTGSADKALFGQLSGYPSAMGLSSFLMASLAFLPGIPALPFLGLSIITGYFAWHSTKKKEQQAQQEVQKQQVQETKEQEKEAPIADSLHIDNLRLEVGFNLISLIKDEQNNKLTEQIKALRKQLAKDMGFLMPSVRIQDNMQINQNEYVIRVKEIDSGRGNIMPHMHLVLDPKGEPITLPGEETIEPTFGLPAKWINENLREEAFFKGYTVVDPSTVVTTHITEVIKDNMADLLSYAETQKLIEGLPKEQKKLIEDIVPQHISISGIQKVLQNLLSERISIRDLPTILEGIAETAPSTRNNITITEQVRTKLSRQLSDMHANDQGIVPLVTLSQEWETGFYESLVGTDDNKQLSMAPSLLQDFIAKVKQAFEEAAMQGESPVLLTGPLIRPHVRSVIERFRPMTVVMSQNEIHPKAKIKTVGQVA